MRTLTTDEQKLYDELRGKMEEYAETVDVLPYSHNLLSLALREVANKLGRDVANHLIDELELEALGYHKVSDES